MAEPASLLAPADPVRHGGRRRVPASRAVLRSRGVRRQLPDDSLRGEPRCRPARHRRRESSAIPHASAVASAAARMITKGRYAPHYWSSLGIGIALPLLIVVFGGNSGIALAAAGALALAGPLPLRMGVRLRAPADPQQLSHERSVQASRRSRPTRGRGSSNTRLPTAGTTGSSGTRRRGRGASPATTRLVPTVCFNCESACGLLAWVDNDTMRDPKVRGEPGASRQPRPQLRQGAGDAEPGQRPRPDPLPDEARRRRGEGKWTRVSWAEALDGHRRAHPQARSRRSGRTRSCTTSAGRDTTA